MRSSECGDIAHRHPGNTFAKQEAAPPSVRVLRFTDGQTEFLYLATARLRVYAHLVRDNLRINFVIMYSNILLSCTAILCSRWLLCYLVK